MHIKCFPQNKLVSELNISNPHSQKNFNELVEAKTNEISEDMEVDSGSMIDQTTTTNESTREEGSSLNNPFTLRMSNKISLNYSDNVNPLRIRIQSEGGENPTKESEMMRRSGESKEDELGKNLEIPEKVGVPLIRIQESNEFEEGKTENKTNIMNGLKKRFGKLKAAKRRSMRNNQIQGNFFVNRSRVRRKTQNKTQGKFNLLINKMKIVSENIKMKIISKNTKNKKKSKNVDETVIHSLKRILKIIQMEFKNDSSLNEISEVGS